MSERITFEQWEATYKPINNVLVDDSSFDGIMFETYGIEVKHVCEVANATPNNVWTLMDSEIDDSVVILNGYRLVNRLGYFITENPCVGDYVAVQAWA